MGTIAFALKTGEYLYYRELTDGEKCSFGGHKKDTVHIDGFDKKQIEMSERSGALSIKTKTPFEYNSSACPKGEIVTLDAQKNYRLMVAEQAGFSEQTLQLPYSGIIRFGRSHRNDVILDFPFVSKQHFQLRVDADSVRLEDCGSSHGIYLNGRRVRAGTMHTGDALQIWTLRMVLKNGVLYFGNVGERLRIGEIKSGEMEAAQAVQVRDTGAFLTYHRSPRTQEQLPEEQIVLANPPGKSAAYERRRSMLAYLIGPGVMMAASLATMGAASPALLLARSAGLVTPLVSVATSGSMDKKQKKRLEEYEKLRKERFGAYIEDQKRHIEEVARQQRSIITMENPSPTECMKIVLEVRRNLWERMPADRDFLDIRLGMGYEPLCVPVKSRAEANGFRMEDDEMEQVVQQIVEETRIVDRVPARVPLCKYQTVGIIGNRHRARDLMRSLLVEMTCQHSPQDVQLVAIFDKEERGTWSPLRWLPHIWDAEGQFRYIAFDEKRTHTVCDLLYETLKKRRRAEQEANGRNMPIPRPYYVVVLGSKSLIAKEQLLELLAMNDPAMGVSTLFLFDDLYSLPQECQFIIDVDHDPCAYDRQGVNRKFFFTPDAPPDADAFDAFARRMSSFRVEERAAAASLPDSITFLNGCGVQHPEQLKIMERWRNSRPDQTLEAPIGVLSNGRTFLFDIHDGSHGPHGLVAGTTGAGKSELLQSWILSMAVHYHPHDVNFVLIDYKGGGMASLLEPLPHVVGKITNIGSGIQRALTALNSENTRRQRLLDRYNVNNISKYQRLYQEGRATEPLPYLIIVADEFAELKKEEPEFMDSLISLARVGRTLGIYLVLATQQPAGIVNQQIDSNTHFRICLKMNSAEDSRAILKHPDAARITRPGRAYIRVGEDEIYELFQSYWSGAPYQEGDAPVDTGENLVRIINTTGERIQIKQAKKVKKSTDLDELAAVTRHICAVAREEQIQPLPGPLLPELAVQLPLTSLLPESAFNGVAWGASEAWLRAPIGMYDDPMHQSQGTQCIDLAADGHCGIYGAPGTGKTGIIKTLLLSLAMCYSPADVQMYIIDCGWSLSSFASLPHVGDVVLSYEEEKIDKLCQLLMQEMETRKECFRRNAVGSLTAYRDVIQADMPAIVLVIDNLAPLFDSCPDIEGVLATITRDGASYGIYLVYSATGTNGLRFKVTQNVRNAVALQLKDRGDYADLVGRVSGAGLPNLPGRAYSRGNPPLEFQTALYIDRPTEPEQNQELENLARRMDRSWSGTRPRRIPVMPETVDLSMLPYRQRNAIPVGINFQTLEPQCVDLSERYNLLICGDKQSGKSAFLATLARLLLSRADNQIYIFDTPSGAQCALQDSAADYCVFSDAEAVERILQTIVEELNTRARARAEAEQTEDYCAETWLAERPQLCLLIDDLRAFVDEVSDDARDTMDRICQMAGGLGIIVAAAACGEDIESYSYRDVLTHTMLESQNGIAVSGAASMYYYFHADSRLEQSGTLAPQDAFLFSANTCSRIRRAEG